MKYNELKTTFCAKIENVMLARAIGMAFLVDLDLKLNFINEVKTVISEAVTNAIVHGCLCNENKMVQLNLSYDDVNLYIEVVDHGVGIADIEKAKEPLFSTMEVFTDKLDVKSRLNDGTRVNMIKQYNES